jgi:hypothetical protein
MAEAVLEADDRQLLARLVELLDAVLELSSANGAARKHSR